MRKTVEIGLGLAGTAVLGLWLAVLQGKIPIVEGIITTVVVAAWTGGMVILCRESK